MKGLFFCFICMILISLLCVASRPLAPNDGHAIDLGAVVTNEGLQSSQTTVTMSSNQMSGADQTMWRDEGTEQKPVNKLGSSPPSCAHKCFGCVPCEAIQVPTTNGRVGVQYANYEPEGWKCKCGPTFYTP